MLPLLPTPVVGNPLRHKQWAGKLVPIVGAAALAAEACTDPYILRLGRDDQSGRLRIGDLLLISQQPLDEVADWHPAPPRQVGDCATHC